ncbi:DUF350 domain-containing protein [Wolbachia endosymbiont of Anurida maritima]|uniref:DUF350 domain-containing protein n=1 Tax=Wolbachia endosymbiont of Anurida maritima TaxID=2850562 RepID=UPI0035CF5346
MEKSMPSSKKDINQQLHDTIYKKVTKKTHNHESPKKNGDGTIKKCIELFKQGASSEVLTQLEESLKGQEEYHGYYIKNFLPALKTEITNSEKLDSKKRAIIVEIILDITNKSNAMEPFNEQSLSGKVEIPKNSGINPLERGSLAKGVSGTGTPGTYKILRSSGHNSASAFPTLEQSQLNGSFSQPCEDLENEDPSTIADAVEVPRSANTSKLSNDNGSDSGIDSPRKSEESLESPISSRRSSMSSILSSAGENNDPQKEDTGNQMQPEQTAEEEPQVSSQCVTLGSREKESMDTNSQTTQMTGSQAKDSMQPEEKKDKKNVITTAQKLPVNEKKGEVKQPNNRNLHVALVAGCALSTIGCIVAGAMTSGLVGAGLLAMAAVFAIAAVAELHSNFLSSKLTSISVEPHVNDKELTACSHL